MRPSRRGPAWRLQYGASVRAGGVDFRVWAPNRSRMAVRILGAPGRTVSMSRMPGDEFVATVDGIEAGADYLYVLDGKHERPDPVSRWQPHGVHGPSRIVDPSSFSWSDQAWRGIPLQDFILYELHVGTFTPEGTFEGVIPRLPYLCDLGITAVEIMPVAEFPGGRNWGYDGVHLYAPQSSYGGPTGLKKLVNACHQHGLAVVLDVVYNHLGPEGNYLPEFGPCFTDAYHTPWGKAVNYDGPESDGVRRWVIDNALYWLTEYHVDALRLDAVHGIYDFSARHILEELSESFHAQAERLRRKAWLIAESDLEDVRIINPRSAGGYAIDAQWHDDFHHAVYGLLTGRRERFLADFGSLSDLAKSVVEGFVMDGKYSHYRRRRFGSSSRQRPGEQFVGFVQNHDQVANTSGGKRLPALVSLPAVKLAAVVTLCSPFVPLLFMGEEYAETAPFLYFTSFEDEGLAKAVREGRKREMSAHFPQDDFPDPQAPRTLEASRLDWSKPAQSLHAQILRLYHDLIALRKRHPCLHKPRKDLTEAQYEEEGQWLVLRRSDPSGSGAIILCNFSHRAQSLSLPASARALRLAVWTGGAAYGGNSAAPVPERVRANKKVSVRLDPSEAAVYVTEDTPGSR